MWKKLIDTLIVAKQQDICQVEYDTSARAGGIRADLGITPDYDGLKDILRCAQDDSLFIGFFVVSCCLA